MRFFLVVLLTLLLVLLFSPVAVSQLQPETPLYPKSRVRLPEHVAEQNLVIKADPVYPEFARRGHVEGTVTVDVTVDADGHVQSVVPLGGPTELYGAAETTVRQWRFHPYRQNGVGVPFDARIRIRFKLPEVDL
jgi:TonB family protein